jgi:hypothetical protein
VTGTVALFGFAFWVGEELNRLKGFISLFSSVQGRKKIEKDFGKMGYGGGFILSSLRYYWVSEILLY